MSPRCCIQLDLRSQKRQDLREVHRGQFLSEKSTERVAISRLSHNRVCETSFHDGTTRDQQ